MTQEQVLEDVTQIIRSLAEDWDYTDDITGATRLFDDMNWQSVDMVVLANEVQTHYGRKFPFAEFFERLKESQHSGVTVGELADFLFQNLASGSSSTNSPA